MAVPLQYEGLQIEEDMRWQQVAWRLQRIGWVGFVVIVLLAIVGLLGPGWLGSKTATAGDVHVAYDRFVHRSAAVAFEVTVPAEGGQAEVWLEREYASAMGIERAVPEPKEVALDDERVRYIFTAAEGARSVSVRFDFKPGKIGRVSGAIGSGQAHVDLWHIVYP